MRGTNPRRRGAALLVIASIAAFAASAIGQRDGEPNRDDIVARFSSGVVRLEWGSDTTTTDVTGGRLSISTNDPRCANTLEAPCVYTINEVRLEAMNPFSIGGFDFDGVIVGTTGPGFNQVQTFLGATSVRGLPFWVIGNVGGQRFAFHGAEDPRSYLSVGDLQMGPAASSAVLFGNLVGVIEGRPSEIRFSVTADTPFENRPPYVDPTAPAEVAAACVADVPIDPGLTDVDGDVIARWAEIEGLGIGGVTAPVQLPLGRHVVSVGAEDRYGALGLGRVAIDVVSDGTIPLEPGTELLDLAVPRGTSASSFALVGEESITIMPNASVVTGTDGAPIASLGALTLGVGASTGEAWAVDDATLANRSHVRGPLHVGGDLSASASAVIDGGVVRDGPYTPFETARFVIPSAGTGDDVRLRPGETASLAAGAHGAVDLAPRSRLVLAHGAHSLISLALAPGAEIVVEGDAANPTIVRVEGSFRWQGSVSGSSGPALAIVVMSSAAVQLHSTFDGWIIAPRAEVTLLPGCSTYRGAVIARAVRIQPNVVVEHIPLAFALPDDALSACALTPLVTCVRDNPDGSQTAVFGYSSLLRHIAAVVPRGAANRLYPPLVPSTDHQSFDPIGKERAFEVTFDDEVRWILGTRSALANQESPRCL